MTQAMVLSPTGTGTQSATAFCSQTTLPTDVSQASCVSLVTNALNDPGESTLLHPAPLYLHCKHSSMIINLHHSILTQVVVAGQ